MAILQRLDALLEWLTPEVLKSDVHAKKRVRMFLMSHLFGPFLGAPIWLSLLILDPAPWPHVQILAALITAFWLFPIALKLFPNHYTTLAVLSVLNLSSAILWGSYNYGGASSPFLMWLLVMPLLGFFYLGSNLKTHLVIFAQIVCGLAGLYGIYRLENSFPEHIPLSEMVGMGVISAFCAAGYVFFMAIYYSRVVDSQSELLKEISRHEATMDALRTSKEEAERANGAKSDFLAKMSHELRTPLNAVLGYSEILLEDAELEGRGEQIADLGKISAAGKHLLAMVNDILDISKIEAGKMDLSLEPVDLAQFFYEVESTARPLAAKNTNSFTAEIADDLGTINGDATKLRQAIFNLLSNAAKFTQNGEIAMAAVRRSRQGQDWIEITVTDTGVGISHEQQALLFANFSQANAGIAAKFGGTGLGLSLSRNLCRLMGGDIAVWSEPGRGSRFTITVPALDPAASADGEADLLAEAVSDLDERRAGYSGLAVAPHGTQLRILVVDDDPNILELAERVLNKEGYSPICTDAPQAALQIARTVKPAAVLVDIQMPGLTGWDVLDALKSDPLTASIPVLMLSIFDERQRAMESGASGLIAKPVDGKKLRAALTAAIETPAIQRVRQAAG